MTVPAPRYCGACGAPLVERLVVAERCKRLVCEGCGSVAYRNPQVLVSTIVSLHDRVLLCKRAEPPAQGRWALPGGFMECQETLEEAAVRETFEETGIRIEAASLRLHAVSSLPEISEVYIGFRAQLAEAQAVDIGAECEAARFFGEAEVPWAELSYPDVAQYLRKFFEEQQHQDFAVHVSRLDAAAVTGSTYRIAEVSEIRRSKLAADRGRQQTNEDPAG